MATTRTAAHTQPSMRLIEALLLWEGGVSNERVRELLGCTSVHASRLLSAYRKQFPRQITRSEGATLGEYGAGGHIRAVLTNGTPQEYLQLVEAAPSAQVTRVQTNYSLFEPSLFGVLQRAAAEASGVLIDYQTLTQPAPAQRLVYPHQVIEVGHRWHIRAWDSRADAFADFTLGQILSCRPTSKSSPVTSADDPGWITQVDIGIRSHDDLDSDQDNVVSHEYFTGTAGRLIRTRGCLVRHIVEAMKIALDPALQKPPNYLFQAREPQILEPWLAQGSTITEGV